jgi:hypothetical protein
MAAVLASARLIHTPSFAAPEVKARFVEDRRADFEANARNLLYVALTRARDRLVLEWPAFLKEREEEAPEASCLFHVFEDNCSPVLGAGELRIGGVACPANVTGVPEQAGFTEFGTGTTDRPARPGAGVPLPPVPQSPWRLQPSQLTARGAAPVSRGITLGPAWGTVANDATRGTALHLALRTHLTRPELAPALPEATGLDPETLAAVSARAEALKGWLTSQGYTRLICEIPTLGQTPEGAEIPGTIDLLAIGPDGCMLIDHKSGGTGTGLGPYWPQLAAYARLVPELLHQSRLRGAAIFWIDHGTLEVVEMAEACGSSL